jgi:hypothetical protein
MTDYYIDDGGDNTTGLSWATAWTSFKAAQDDGETPKGSAGSPWASTDVVYVGHNHVCQATHAANLTITGPASGLPCKIISATQGSSPPTYAASVTDQIDTTESTYSITFDGSFALYGIRMESGAGINIGDSDANEATHAKDCTFVMPANGNFSPNGSSTGARIHLFDCTIDLTADGTTPRSTTVISAGNGIHVYRNISFVNAGYRTGQVFGNASNGQIEIDGCDFSGFTNATLCELVSSAVAPSFTISNCKTASTWAPFGTNAQTPGAIMTVTNTGPEAAPTYLALQAYQGNLYSTTAIYRTGGATIGSTNTSWLITTTANCGEGAPFYTPWIYGNIGSTGSKTFDCYITNDTADLTDADAWLEVEYLATSGSPKWTLATDQRTITTTAAAQTDDVTSTWTEYTGSGTYSQTGTVVTVTDTAHGLVYGSVVLVDVTGTGGVTDGTYTLTSVADANTFTFTASTGNGSGDITWQMAPVYTYKQKLSVTATVNQTGQYRARVAVGKASIASTAYLYVDPKITVT